MPKYIESADDINQVFTNWANENIAYVEKLSADASSIEEHQAYENVLTIIRDLPIDVEYSVNEFVANREYEIEESFQTVPDFSDIELIFDDEEEKISEDDSEMPEPDVACGCAACRLRRVLESPDAPADPQNTPPLGLLLAALMSQARRDS